MTTAQRRRTWGRVAVAIAALSLSATTTSCTRSTVPPAGPVTAPVPADFGLSPFTVVVESGSSGQEHYGQVTLSWLVSPTARITVSNVSSPDPSAVLTAQLRLTPCGGPVNLEVAAPDGRTVRTTASHSGDVLSLALRVPRGETVTIPVHVTTSACRIPTDRRTFFAGLVNLLAAPGS